MDTLLLLIAASALSAVSPQITRGYYFYYDHKNWTEALNHCRQKHTDLATITSLKDVDTLRSMADLSKMVYSEWSSRAWIGLYNDMHSWRWSLSDSGFYNPGETEFRLWSDREPNNGDGNEHCTMMYGDGKWNDGICLKRLQAVCCNVTGSDVTFVLINTPMSWTEAQSYCRDHHTDLASVRNMAENQKVKDLIPSGQDVWIGLFRETWKWTDGSNSSFRYWSLGASEPNNLATGETCSAADFDKSGEWEDWTCDWKRAFICYTAGITKQVFRLSVQKMSPSLDLSDSTVMEDVLQQLKQKLKDEGLNKNIQLSWRKQPDGNIFQKVETEEKKDEMWCAYT